MRKVNTKPRLRYLAATCLLAGLAATLVPAATAAAGAPAVAAGTPVAPALAPPLPPDAGTAPRVRRPVASRLDNLRGQRAFQYLDVAPDDPGLWDRFLAWLWRKYMQLRSTENGRLGSNIFFYGLLGAALAFGVSKLLQLDLARAFGRAPRALPLGYEAGQENIHELNFPDAIADAEASGNLRLAVRLGYLQLLKRLTDQDLIAWQPDKTNQTYLHELAAQRPTAQPAFTELTRQFEYIWYGEWPLGAPLYQQVRGGQQAFLTAN